MDPEIIKKWSTGGVGFLKTINRKELIDQINKDDPTEQVILGNCYEYGLGGLEIDEKEAVRLYKLSAEQNNSYGQAHLGVCYEKGMGGLDIDEEEAVRLYKLSAEQNNSFGQVRLGVCYEYVIGRLFIDEKEAVRLYKLSAEQNNSFGQVRLGVCYVFGIGGLSIDEKEAVRLYKLSAEQNNSFGQNNLERMKRLHPYLFIEPRPFVNQTIHSDDTCSICLEEFIGVSKAVMILQCTHKYHFSCLTSWFTSQATKQCPVCRTYVS